MCKYGWFPFENFLSFTENCENQNDHFLAHGLHFYTNVTEICWTVFDIPFQLTSKHTVKKTDSLADLLNSIHKAVVWKHTLLHADCCEFRWGFNHLCTVLDFFLFLIFPFTCCPVRRKSIPEGQISLFLIHKQPIVLHLGLALHLIFTYPNTSLLLPLPPPQHFISCHSSEMRLLPALLVQIGGNRGWE